MAIPAVSKMQKAALTVLVLPLLGAALCSCTIKADSSGVEANFSNAVSGSGKLKEETRSLPPFDKIELANEANVAVAVGEGEQSVKVSIDDNLLPLVKTTVADKTLTISSEKPYNTSLASKIAITLPGLRAFSLSGAGNAEIKNVKGEKFESTIAGSGNITVSGDVKDEEVSLSGAGNVNAKELKAQIVKVHISGSGNTDVSAEQTLDADISGSGNINYYGKPKLTQNVSGAGAITAK